MDDMSDHYNIPGGGGGPISVAAYSSEEQRENTGRVRAEEAPVRNRVFPKATKNTAIEWGIRQDRIEGRSVDTLCDKLLFDQEVFLKNS